MTKNKATKLETQDSPGRAPVVRLQEKIEILKRLLPDLQKDYEVRSMGIFGSYARGHQKRRSDVDILVEFDRPPSLFGFIRLERYLSRQLNANVDLVMKSALKPVIGRRILEEVIYL